MTNVLGFAVDCGEITILDSNNIIHTCENGVWKTQSGPTLNRPGEAVVLEREQIAEGAAELALQNPGHVAVLQELQKLGFSLHDLKGKDVKRKIVKKLLVSGARRLLTIALKALI